MKGYGFDPRRLACSQKQQERNRHATAARMLRDYLGGDIFAEIRERARRDPRLRAIIQAASETIAPAGDRTLQSDRRRARRPRGRRSWPLA